MKVVSPLGAEKKSAFDSNSSNSCNLAVSIAMKITNIPISPTHKRTEGRAPVWGSEFTSKAATLQGDPAERAAKGWARSKQSQLD